MPLHAIVACAFSKLFSSLLHCIFIPSPPCRHDLLCGRAAVGAGRSDLPPRTCSRHHKPKAKHRQPTTVQSRNIQSLRGLAVARISSSSSTTFPLVTGSARHLLLLALLLVSLSLSLQGKWNPVAAASEKAAPALPRKQAGQSCVRCSCLHDVAADSSQNIARSTEQS